MRLRAALASLLVAVALSACGGGDSEPATEPAASTAMLSGSVMYHERMALPVNAVINVRLLDVSLADAPARVLAEQTIEARGQSVPISYTLEYDPSQVRDNLSYAVRAEIRDADGDLLWTNAFGSSHESFMSLFKAIRVGLLLLVLVIVAGNHWLGMARLAAWDRPIWITVYPINADGAPETARYIDALDASDFNEIGAFFSRQAAAYGVDVARAAHFQLAAAPATAPPPLPDGASRLGIAWWSLKMRWWAWRQAAKDGLPTPDIQVCLRDIQGDPC